MIGGWWLVAGGWWRVACGWSLVACGRLLVADTASRCMLLHIDIPHWMGLMCNRNKKSHRHHRLCYDHRHHGQHRHVYLHLYLYSGSYIMCSSSLSYNRYHRYRYHHYHSHRIHVSVAVFAHECACILPGSRLFGRFSRSVSSIAAGSGSFVSLHDFMSPSGLAWDGVSFLPSFFPSLLPFFLPSCLTLQQFLAQAIRAFHCFLFHCIYYRHVHPM